MNLAKKLAKYAGKSAFFYVTLDPERALGVEDILPNYTIICPWKSALTDKLKKGGVSVIVLEQNMLEREVGKIVERGTYGMLRDKFVQNAINKVCGTYDVPHKAHIMVLKNSELIEEICKKQDWKLLAPRASIAEQFESKISQYKLLKKVVPYPKIIITTLNKICESLRGEDAMSPRTSARRHSYKYALQFNRGHSGNTTFFIKAKKDLEKLYKLFPKREVKISQYIKGKTYTLNCLLFKNGKIITGSLSMQITGLRSATNNPNTTVGNDFGAAKALSKNQVKKIQKIAVKTGEAMHKKGYKGLFGIDVIIEKDSGEIYFIELNTHQPASISFESKLHRSIGKTPLLAYFILDNLEKLILKHEELPPIILPVKAKQIIYRNKSPKVLTQKYIAKYKNRGLLSRLKFIKPNEEMYRRQQYSNITI